MEVLKRTNEKLLLFSTVALGIYALSFLAFSRELKDQVRKEQKGICAWCGKKPKKLTIHHIVPQSMGGKDTRENAVGLCRSCHDYWDEQALKKGVFYPKER